MILLVGKCPLLSTFGNKWIQQQQSNLLLFRQGSYSNFLVCLV
nr:MAG TPA: hypothetical protein [Caudoviricetes sp.]